MHPNNKQLAGLCYYRVSSDEQAKGSSLDVQQQRITEHCHRINKEILNEWKEDHSAKTFERPRYRELEQFAKKYANKIDTIYVLTWDRFSRDASLAYQKLDLFKRLGITVQAVEQPIDFSIPENKMMLAFYLSYPQVENERRSLKILSGVRAGK